MSPHQILRYQAKYRSTCQLPSNGDRRPPKSAAWQPWGWQRIGNPRVVGCYDTFQPLSNRAKAQPLQDIVPVVKAVE